MQKYLLFDFGFDKLYLYGRKKEVFVVCAISKNI